MSEVFAYVCTKSTVDPYLPPMAANQARFARDVADGFAALSGGHFTVGKLAFFPMQRSVPNHLLCDGREVAKASFPELFDFLGDSQGTSTDADYFVLPNYLGSLTPAATADIETATGGTVTTPDPTPPAPTDPPVEYPTYGDVDSGGRYRRISGTEDEP